MKVADLHYACEKPDGSPKRQLNIGIVGAGFAGLRCADVLLQQGCRVTIFEARDRLGGRVAQSSQLGHVVDLGPNWIHGTNGNPMMDLAKSTGTVLHSWEAEQFVIGTDGRPWDAEDAEECSRIFWDDGLIAQAFRYSNEHCDSINVGKSLFDFFDERIQGMFEELPREEMLVKRQRLRDMATVWSAYIGSSVKVQSLKYFWLEECVEGENPFVAGTYERILERVARPAREHAKILLNTEIVQISSSTSGHGQDVGCSVRTADGSAFDFDKIIVTTPLGYLKIHPDLFEPALPPRLSQAIENLGYGSLDKIYVRFESAFWNELPVRDGGKISQTLDLQYETPNVASTTTPVCQAQSNNERQRPNFPGSIHWLPPTYASATNPHGWDIQGMNLAALPKSCAHPTILFYIYGECSRHVAALVASATSQSQRDESLIEFVEPYFSRLPNYHEEDERCRPLSVLATAWAGDEFAGYGSYTNFPVGLEKGDEDIELLRHGMPERGIFLAGEHTAPLIALGTSTGAYWSGEAVAKRIVNGCKDIVTPSNL